MKNNIRVVSLNEAQKILGLTYSQVRYLKNKGILTEVPSIGHAAKISYDSVIAYKERKNVKV